ncbi:hypothetical protein ACCT30_38645, partial [Rhizobium ruizarguesonis]
KVKYLKIRPILMHQPGCRAAREARAGRVSIWSFGGVRKRPDVHHMPRIGTMISGFIAAMEWQVGRARVSDL